MIKLKPILGRGYFPPEMPPMFTTESFSSIVDLSLPSAFEDTSKTALVCRHDIPSIKLRRRIASLVNPITYYCLAKSIAANWNEIDTHCQASRISASSPAEGGDSERSIKPQKTHDELSFERLGLRSMSRYILKTDISRFYPSIYTHSIPWALHTKKTAKANRKPDALLGNLLDRNLRNTQDGQTIGIPIGPDTSLVIAEIILSSIDKDLCEQIPNIRGFRHIDDYEFGFVSYGEAEATLGHIRNLLSEFELELNMSKTSIVELPTTISAIWTSELRGHLIREEATSQQFDLYSYFDKSITLARRHPEERVLKYALRRLRSVKVALENWPLVERFVFQCLMVDSSTFSTVLLILRWFYDKDYPLNRHDLAELLNLQIRQLSKPLCTNEMCWALWGLIYWKLRINEDTGRELSTTSDSAIALMSLHARESGLINGKLDTTHWQTMLPINAALYSQYWLLAYESDIRDWLGRGVGNMVKHDDCFGFLMKHNISFYDTQRIAIDIGQAGMDSSYPGL
ncbi:MAG: RNA-directed DNA polymerase [Anaerolineae bacterium]|nr:RNA-directed DNA polymerase [Anaerolineae bacterium]